LKITNRVLKKARRSRASCFKNPVINTLREVV
jgi:hypothetical protein